MYKYYYKNDHTEWNHMYLYVICMEMRLCLLNCASYVALCISLINFSTSSKMLHTDIMVFSACISVICSCHVHILETGCKAENIQWMANNNYTSRGSILEV